MIISRFDQALTVPPNLRVLKLGDEFDTEINLSSLLRLEILQFGDSFDRTLDITLPPNLKVVVLGKRFNQVIDFPPGLEEAETTRSAGQR